MLFQEHLAKHAGDKPYKCEVCPKQFNHKTDLRRHMCLHTGEKPFTCDVCGKGFIREDRMVKHADTHKKKAQVGGGLMWQQADTGGHVYWPGGQVSGHHHMWLPVHVAAPDFRSTWLARKICSLLTRYHESQWREPGEFHISSDPFLNKTSLTCHVSTCLFQSDLALMPYANKWVTRAIWNNEFNKLLYRKWFCRSFVKI